MTDGSDTCGAPTQGGDGPPCQHPTTDDGDSDRCWIDAHNDAEPDAEQPGRPRDAPSKSKQEQIASDIENGASVTAAIRRAGINKATFYNWLEYGENQKEGIYADFLNRITRARGEGEEHYRGTAFDMAKEEGDTATLMAMLKQRYPESWGDVDRGEQSGSIVVNLDEPDEYDIDPDTLEVQE